MTNPFDFLHIKGRTVGSSNELSFDVLDAAAASNDAAAKRRSGRGPASSRVSRGSYHGVAGTSTLSAVPEVERRKRARRSRMVRLYVLGFVVLVALVGAVTFFAYRFYQQRVDFNGHFNALIGEITEVDQTLAEVDSLMKNPLNSVEADARAQALRKLPGLSAQLEGLIGEAEAMMGQGRSGGEQTALDEVCSAARARLDMVAAAGDAFELSAEANGKASIVEDAWALVLVADGDARAATEQANAAATEQATLAARDKTQQARDEFEEALAALEAVEKSVGSALFSAQETFIEKRVEALDYALATSDALLANDREAAAAANSAYNSADQQAAEAAGRLPLDAPGQVKELYEDRLERLLGAYARARSQASEADAVLRTYLR